MRIGIDIHHLRLDQRGIYYYLWNTLEQLCCLDLPHSLTLYLYGQPWMIHPHLEARVRSTFAKAALCYHWDGPSNRLLSDQHRRNGAPVPRWIRGIDRRLLLPIYRKVLRLETRYPRKARFLTWPWHSSSPARAVDVFHHPAGLIFPLSAKANVMTVHDLIPLRFPDYNAEATAYFGESYAQAVHMDLLIAVSRHTRKDIVELLGIPEERIHVVPEAAHPQYRLIEDEDLIVSVLDKYSLAKGNYLLYLGALERRKNIPRLVEAFARLRQRQPDLPHRLVLAGGGDPTSAEETRCQIANQGLTPYVRLLGHVPFEDLPVLICGADAFVFPSLYEGFGLPPLEAMACGTPVIASNTTSLPEVVGDGGILIDPTNIDDIANAMHEVITNRTLRAELADRGLKRARSFSWQQTARLTLEAYEEAWRRWQKDGRPPKPTPKRTSYQAKLHEWVLEQTHERVRQGDLSAWSGTWP
jgi:glycosyltransferase involved in cell wall biosynthesis